MPNPGARLKLEMDKFMGAIIEEASKLSMDEFQYRHFRKAVLDKGNTLIREFNLELAKHNVHYKVGREELLREEENK